MCIRDRFQHRIVDAGILYVAALGFQIFVKQCKDIRRNALLAEQAQGRQLQGQACLLYTSLCANM